MSENTEAPTPEVDEDVVQPLDEGYDKSDNDVVQDEEATEADDAEEAE